MVAQVSQTVHARHPLLLVLADCVASTLSKLIWFKKGAFKHVGFCKIFFLQKKQTHLRTGCMHASLYILARYARFAARAPAIHGHGNYVGLIYRFRPYVLICVDRWCIAMGRRLHHRYIVLGVSL